MTSRDLVYWLQGLFELGNPTTLDAAQTATIKRHVALVFKHEIDPSMGDAAHQAKLNETHKPPTSSQSTPQTWQSGAGTSGAPDRPVLRC